MGLSGKKATTGKVVRSLDPSGPKKAAPGRGGFDAARAQRTDREKVEAGRPSPFTRLDSLHHEAHA